MYECFPTRHLPLASDHLCKRFFVRIEGGSRNLRRLWTVSSPDFISQIHLILQDISGNSQPDGSCQPTSSTTEMSDATRKAQLDTGIQRPGSPPNSRSQSPDSMKISTPEPPEPPSVPLQNGIHPTPLAWLDRTILAANIYLSFILYVIKCKILGKL